jgi:hypothetical protein
MKSRVLARFRALAPELAVASLAAVLVLVAGCSNRSKYQVLLATDARTYQPQMSWDQIRESGYPLPYTLRVFDSQKRSVPLFRYKNPELTIMPLDDTLIHISTPIIIEKKYTSIYVSVLDHETEVTNIQVNTELLTTIPGDERARALPIPLPALIRSDARKERWTGKQGVDGSLLR